MCDTHTDSARSAGRRHAAVNGRLVGVGVAREHAHDKVAVRGEVGGGFSPSNKKKKGLWKLNVSVLSRGLQQCV